MRDRAAGPKSRGNVGHLGQFLLAGPGFQGFLPVALTL